MSLKYAGEIDAAFGEPMRRLFAALLLAGGQIGLPILILTFALSKRVHRNPTLVNLWISGVIYSISFCVLIYSGQDGTSFPPTTACLASSALVHGGPAMSTVAVVMVVYQMWHALQDPIQTHAPSSSRLWSLNMKICLLVPYIVLFAYTITSIIIGQLYPEKVYASYSGLFCTIHHYDSFGIYGVPVFCALMMVMVIALEIMIGYRFYRVSSQISRVFPLARRRASISLIFRIGLFSVYSIIVFCVSLLGFVSDGATVGQWVYMVEASMPLCAVLIFGTQRDVINVWCFWRRPIDSSTAASEASNTSAMTVLARPVLDSIQLTSTFDTLNSEISTPDRAKHDVPIVQRTEYDNSV